MTDLFSCFAHRDDVSSHYSISLCLYYNALLIKMQFKRLGESLVRKVS